MPGYAVVAQKSSKKKKTKQNVPLDYGLDFAVVHFYGSMAGTLVWIYLFSKFINCHDG